MSNNHLYSLLIKNNKKQPKNMIVNYKKSNKKKN
jgi:hypothetical protein